jgi:hypothetical protein
VGNNDTRLFLLFNKKINVDGKLQHIIGWGHLDLIFECKHAAVNIFIDCTFKVVPMGFRSY